MRREEKVELSNWNMQADIARPARYFLQSDRGYQSGKSIHGVAVSKHFKTAMKTVQNQKHGQPVSSPKSEKLIRFARGYAASPLMEIWIFK